MPSHFIVELLSVSQHRACPDQQRVASRREFNAFGASHQQRRAETVFQIGNALAHRRCHGVRTFRRSRNAAGIGYGHEQFQIAKVESHAGIRIHPARADCSLSLPAFVVPPVSF